MPYLPNRHPIRNPYHDYSQPSTYFITIDVGFGQCLFGHAKSEKEIELNPLGKTAESCWLSIPEHFPHVLLGKFVVMPNHIHGIVHVGTVFLTEDQRQAINIELAFFSAISPFGNLNHFGPLKKGSLAVILGQYKGSVTRWANDNNYGGLFEWHDLYFDRIIKNKEALIKAEKYIEQNPTKWWAKYGNKEW